MRPGLEIDFPDRRTTLFLFWIVFDDWSTRDEPAR